MRIAVIAHDAGGANILAALMRRHAAAFEWHALAAGPALRSFASPQRGTCTEVPLSNEPSLLEALGNIAPHVVLTGTGWQSDLERSAVRCARQLHVPVASMLDHWVNYRERFGFPGNWLEQLPDRVLIGDRYAHAQARADGFPADSLLPIENPYLAAFMAERASVAVAAGGQDGLRVLLAGEPLSISFGTTALVQAPLSEVELAHQIASVILDADPTARLTVRSHPSQPASVYSSLLESRHARRIVLRSASDGPLEADLAAADVVVGASSMALLAAAAAGRHVVAFVPNGLRCDLPHREIHRCRDGVELLAFMRGRGVPSRLNLELYADSLPDVVATLTRSSVLSGIKAS